MQIMFQSPTRLYCHCAQYKGTHKQRALQILRQLSSQKSSELTQSSPSELTQSSPSELSQSSPSELSQSSPSELTQSSPKPFDSIPGPKALPFIGSIYNYFPGGKYYNLSLFKSGILKYNEYGMLVREKVLQGRSIVWVFNPKDMETLFLNEMRYPTRRSHLALKKYRKDRPHIYNDGGLLPTNNEEWWRLRKQFQKDLSALPCVRSYLPDSDDIIRKFVQEDLTEALSQNKKQDFLPLVSRLFLQLVGFLAFDVNLNCFTTDERQFDSKSSRLLRAVEVANSLILPLDNSEEKWMKKETRDYRKFAEAVSVMEEVAVELVQKKMEFMKSSTNTSTNKVPSLLEKYLTSEHLDEKDVVGMALDILLAGIDTTAYTLCYALYHLTTKQDVQYYVLKEAINVLGSPGSQRPITAEVLANIPYTRAVLKEVFRLSPISVGVGRITTEDMVLSGYHIPAKTEVVTQNQVTCRLGAYFRLPNEFVPERWFKGHPFQTVSNPYLALPFGHGPRACIARRLAEQHLLTFILRFVHNYNISWPAKTPLGTKMGHINVPVGPVVFSYMRRY